MFKQPSNIAAPSHGTNLSVVPGSAMLRVAGLRATKRAPAGWVVVLTNQEADSGGAVRAGRMIPHIDGTPGGPKCLRRI